MLLALMLRYLRRFLARPRIRASISLLFFTRRRLRCRTFSPLQIYNKHTHSLAGDATRRRFACER